MKVEKKGLAGKIISLVFAAGFSLTELFSQSCDTNFYKIKETTNPLGFRRTYEYGDSSGRRITYVSFEKTNFIKVPEKDSTKFYYFDENGLNQYYKKNRFNSVNKDSEEFKRAIKEFDYFIERIKKIENDEAEYLKKF